MAVRVGEGRAGPRRWVVAPTAADRCLMPGKLWRIWLMDIVQIHGR